MTDQPLPKTGLFKKLGTAALALVIAGGVGATPIIKKWEGRSLTPYYDIAGVLTYCDGETLHADSKKIYTDHECDDLTAARAQEFGMNVAANLEYVVSQKTFDSLIIFSYNNGKQAFNTSSVLRKINAGDVAGGCEAMMLFVCYTVPAGKGDMKPTKYKPLGTDEVMTFENCAQAPKRNKKFSKGLANRRADERKLCLAGANAHL